MFVKTGYRDILLSGFMCHRLLRRSGASLVSQLPEWILFRMLVKALIVWLLIAAGEIINGTVRVRCLQRKYGKYHAKNISFISGTAIFSVIIWFFLPWVGPTKLNHCFFLGLLWVSLMVAVDIYFGKFVFRYSWQKIADDFNLRKRNLLVIGMALLFFCPVAVFLLQN